MKLTPPLRERPHESTNSCRLVGDLSITVANQYISLALLDLFSPSLFLHDDAADADAGPRLEALLLNPLLVR